MSFKNFLFLFLCCACTSVYSQVVVTGKVLDSQSGEPLPYAHIFIKGSETGVVSNSEGDFSIEVEKLPVVLVVSEIAHQTQLVRVIKHEVVINLEPAALQLEDVTVRDRKESYFRMANHVLDFDFYDDHILLLGNSGREVRLITHRGTVVERSLTPGRFTEIFKDCLGNLHIVNADTAYQVFYDFEDIRFIYPHSAENFDRYLRGCECRFKDGLIYSMGRKRGLVTSFLYADGGTTKPFYEIGDSAGINYLESEYGLEYFIAQRNAGDDRYAMSVPQLKASLQDLQNTMQFDWMESRILAPAAYYVFPHDGELRIFSLGSRMEYRFTDLAAGPQKKISHISDDGLDYLTADVLSGEIYAIYNSSPGRVHVDHIDNPARKVNLYDHAFPGKVKVHGGYIFFISDPEINGGNFLFRKNVKVVEKEGSW